MAPIKSSLARTVGKLLGVQKDTDLSLRGHVQSLRQLPSVKVTASGGNLSDAQAPGNGYKYHTFSNPGNFTVTAGSGADGIVEVLVVAGGGSGAGTNVAGGAGAGGIVHATGYQVAAGTYPVSVGAGADAPAFSGPNPSRDGNAGADSYFGPSGERLTAKGGAGGGNSYTLQPSGGDPGGSGAGGGTWNPNWPLGSPDQTAAGPASQPGQTHPGAPGTINNYGNNGGIGGGYGPNGAIGGGGGGAGAVGTSNAFPAGSPGQANPSAGGAGQPFLDFAYPLAFPGPVASSLGPNSPNNSHYGGGGGGARHIAGSASAQPGPTAGGVGGGGRGGNGRAADGGYDATDGVNYLGGGGGDCDGYETGGDGGDGIVIIRYVA